MKKIIYVIFSAVLAMLICSCNSVNTAAPSSPAASSSDFSFSFDSNFDNNSKSDISISSYGNLEFSDNAIEGKSILYSNGYLELTGSDKINIQDTFTFSTWFKITDLGGCIDPIFFGKASSNGDIASGPVSIHFSDSYSCMRTELTFICADDSYKSHSFSSDHAFTNENILNSWNNITVVFEKDILTYYLNGKKLNEERIPENIRGYKTIASNSNPFFIGRGAIGEYCGYLDDTMFTTSVIDEKTIAEMYNKGMAKFSSKLILSTTDNKCYTAKKEYLSDAEIKKDASGNTLLPVRPIIEGLGGSLKFEEFDGYGRADITFDNLSSSVWIMDSNAIVNGKPTKLQSYPVFIDDVFYINISFFSQELGFDIKYDALSGEYTLQY